VTVFVKGSDKKILPALYEIPDFAAMARRADGPGVSESEAASLRKEASRHATQAYMREHSRDECGAWSEDGFRTLAFAYRRLPMSAFLEWLPKLREARMRGKRLMDAHLEMHPDDEGGASKLSSIEVAKTTALLERDLVYHGVVGYEDSLQEGVPDAIARLSDAGIKVVMLTGDKEGTALNIGFGVRMLTNGTEILSLTYEGREGALFNASGGSAREALAPEFQQIEALISCFGEGRAAMEDGDEDDAVSRLNAPGRQSFRAVGPAEPGAGGPASTRPLITVKGTGSAGAPAPAATPSEVRTSLLDEKEAGRGGEAS
jgi:magnesium-transporting ATPase (P-type)